jgi:hypothetical protein
MKKLWLAVAAMVMTAMAASTFAEVQNIRLSGDIRIRGYWEKNQFNIPLFPDQGTWVNQRTRITVEADLEDHVLAVVTLQAQGQWGQNSSVQTPPIVGAQPTQDWDAGVVEAYVQFSEMFYSPATLKLGRQYLNYGRGLQISSNEQAWNFDAARLVLDYYPLTVDLVAARVGDAGSVFTPNPDSNLLLVNARYELANSPIKDVEGYIIWLSARDFAAGTINGIPGSPVTVGARADMAFGEADMIKAWVEGAYQFGDAGPGAVESKISAFVAEAGGTVTFKDVTMKPVVNANYWFASGDSAATGDGNYRPLYGYTYRGYAFSPILSNIHIFNLGLTVTPFENTTFSLQGYHYRQVNAQAGAFAGDPFLDNGGYGATTGPTGSKNLGWEIDAILGYDYSKDVRFQLYWAGFAPGGAYVGGNFGLGARRLFQEVRAEVNVKF